MTENDTNALTENDSLTETERSFSMLSSIDAQDKNLSISERKRKITASGNVALEFWERVHTEQSKVVYRDRLTIKQAVKTEQDRDYQAYLEQVELEQTIINKN